MSLREFRSNKNETAGNTSYIIVGSKRHNNTSPPLVTGAICVSERREWKVHINSVAGQQRRTGPNSTPYVTESS